MQLPPQTRAKETIIGQGKVGTVSVSDIDRQSGMYVLGVQGVGKSSLLEQLIYQDISKGYAVIVLDPHGDLIDHVIAQLPGERLAKTYLLDIEDTEYPFGLNLFHLAPGATIPEQQQAQDRVLHVFEKCFPETSRMLLEKYLGNIAPVFFANSQGGYAMTDIPKFLRDEQFRNKLLKNKNVRYFIRSFWEDEFDSMTPSTRKSETTSLATRLNRFMRSAIAGNIVGQTSTTIDFRQAIEQKEIILIRLPIKTLREDASLLGTMLIAQIHAAIFSFADTKLEDRPGFSLFVDEFQHFATSDFAEMFTEGRKFGSRVTVAHQYREQLPDVLEHATLTARTIITFQATHEDAMKMSHLYPTKAEVDRSTIPGDVVKYLIRNGHPNPTVSEFASRYLPFLLQNATRKYGRLSGLTDLNALLISCMRDGNANKDIPEDTMKLCIDTLYDPHTTDDSNKLEPYFKQNDSWSGISLDKPKQPFYWFLKPNVFAMKNQLQELALKGTWWIRQDYKQGRLDAIDNILGLIRLLRATMQELATNPLGQQKEQSQSEIVKQIVNLPRRTAYVRVGKAVNQIATFDTPPAVPTSAFIARSIQIRVQTRRKYARNQAKVEAEIGKRLGIETVAETEGETEVQQARPPAERTPEHTPAQEHSLTPFEEI